MNSHKSGHDVCNPSCYVAQGLIGAGVASLTNEAKALGVPDAVACPVVAQVIPSVVILPNALCCLDVVGGSVWQ